MHEEFRSHQRMSCFKCYFGKLLLLEAWLFQYPVGDPAACSPCLDALGVPALLLGAACSLCFESRVQIVHWLECSQYLEQPDSDFRGITEAGELSHFAHFLFC